MVDIRREDGKTIIEVEDEDIFLGIFENEEGRHRIVTEIPLDKQAELSATLVKELSETLKGKNVNKTEMVNDEG